MMPITKIMNKYHDKKRRLDYDKITKIIKKEQRRRRNDNKKPEEPLEIDSDIEKKKK